MVGGDRIITQSFVYRHTKYDDVTVSVRRNARRMSIRWQRGKVLVTMPPGVRYSDFVKMFDESSHWLDAHTPKLYSNLEPIVTDFFTITFERNMERPGTVWPSRVANPSVIVVSNDLDPDHPEVAARISQIVARLAAVHSNIYDNRHRVVGNKLIEEAKAVSAGLGVSPRKWKVSDGQRVLGSCTGRNDINLSTTLMFLPAKLRHYVYCHELAHLTHHNHSAEFHNLLESYLGAPESEYTDLYKTVRLPLLR